MTKKLKWNKRTIIRWKVYIDRARMYMGYINFFMLGVVFLRSYKDSNWGQFIFNYYYYTFPILFLSFFIFALILGYIDSKMGFREEEMRNNSNSNPVLMEILRTVQELKVKQ